MASLCSLIRKPLKKTSVGYSGFHFSLLISLLTKVFAWWCFQEYSCDWSTEIFSHKCREEPLLSGITEFCWWNDFDILLSNIALHIKIKKKCYLGLVYTLY